MTPRIPFNDLARQSVDDRATVDAAITRVLDRGWYLLGPETEAFEDEFAAYCGAGGTVAVANGTDAIEIALRTVGCVGPDDEVILSANAGNYATTACAAIGATPVYAEIDPVTLLLDPASVGRLVTPSTRAIVATHLYGNVVDIESVRRVAPPGVALVEDCAQAHGASIGGRRVGSLGDVAAFSFYPTKNLGALGDAGAVVSSSADHLERARSLRQYGWTQRYRVGAAGGRNSRIDEVQAAVLRGRLTTLDERNDRRRSIRDRYHEALRARVAVVADAGGDICSVAHLCVVRSPDRDALLASLAADGVDAAIHYPIADHQQPTHSSPVRADDLTQTERACAEVLSLPCFPELGDDEVDRVIAVVTAHT